MKEESKTRINLQVALAGEADANRRYIAYGIRALHDGHPEIAQLFFEAAGAETVHAYSHLSALGAIGTTAENLTTAAIGESGEIEEMYPRMIAEAEAEGNQIAAASFRLALEREKHHQAMFRKAMDDFSRKPSIASGSEAAQSAPMPSAATHSDKSSADIEGRKRRPEHMRADSVRLTQHSAAGSESSAFPTSEISSEADRIRRLGGIKEVVFGSQDGLISTTTLVLGIAAASSSTAAVLIAGGVATLAGTLSMAVGSYLSSRAERQLYEKELRKERGEMQQKPGEETAELIAAFMGRGMDRRDAVEVARRTSFYPNVMLEMLSALELGLTRQSLGSPIRDALVMGAAFGIGSLLPLAPFALLARPEALRATVLVALAALFVVGALKGKLSHRSIVASGLEVMLLGGGAGAIGYFMGQLVAAIAHVSI
ncbi:MAG TPA: VIT1/CCC1 transporter family protein [Blastocatellia bacterium]|nr:VIT1/CCC1 transporter family protein [Blastocatellia bacterium]